MTKRIGCVIASLLLCVVLSVSALAATDVSRLVDGADLLTEQQESVLLERLNTISETYKVDVAVVTVDSADGFGVEDYAENLYDEYGYGYGVDRDGVLLLISMEDQDYVIVSNKLGAKAITKEEGDSIGESIRPFLTDGDYADAFHMFADECEYQINGEINGFPFAFLKNLLISLAIGLVVAFIVTGTMKAKLKSVRKQSGATVYTKQGSMQITNSNDFFLYRTVDRRKKQQSSSSGSSGSSRNVSSGKF